jgi:hypothetical protein
MTEKFDPTKYGGVPYDGSPEEDTTTSGLSPEEEEELRRLEAMKPAQTGLTAAEEEELRQLEAMAPSVAAGPAQKKPEAGDLDESEIREIADTRGVSVEYLKERIPYLAGVTGGYTKEQGALSQVPQRAIAEVGKQVLLGIPQKAYILAQDEKEQAALDDIRELIDAKRTLGQKAAEFGLSFALPGGVIAKGAKTAIGKVAAAAATGATYGATSSRTGEELPAAAMGAAVGGTLGGAIVGVPVAYKGIKNLLSKESVDDAARLAKMADIEAKAEESLKTNQEEISNKAKFFSDPKQIENIIPANEATRTQLRDIKMAAAREKPRGAQKESADALIEQLGKRVESQERAITEAREFAAYIQGGSQALPRAGAMKVLQEAGKREAGFLEKEYNSFRKVKAFEEAQQKTLAARIPKEKNFISRFKELIYDGTVVARGIDREVAGSDMTTVLDKMARNKRLFDTQTAAKLQRSTELKEALTKTGVDNDLAYRVLDTVDLLKKGGREAAIKAGMNEAQADATIAFRKAFEDIRIEADKLGLKIEARDAYVPHLRVSTPETIRRINKEAKRAGLDFEDTRNTPGIDDLIKKYSKYSQYLNSGFKEKLKKPEGLDDFVSNNEAFVNTARALEYVSGEKITNAFDLGVALRQSQSPQLLNRLAITEARRAMQRTQDMPDFIREKNLAKLYLDWSSDTFKHIYFREGLGELKVVRDLAVAANNRSAADYVERLRQDLTGLRHGTGLEWTRQTTQKFQLTMKTLADKSPENSYKKQIYETLGESPEIFSIIASQVYPNFLGLSAKAIIANLTSPFTMAVPELGGAYGTKKLLTAGIQSANYMRAGRKVSISQELASYLNSKKYAGKTDYVAGQNVVFNGMDALTMSAKNAGYMGPQYSSELFRAVEGGIKDSAVYNMGMSTVEKWNTFAMYAFEKSETAIRSMMSDVADGVAIDLLRGNKDAMKFIGKMDRAYQIKIQKAMAAGPESSKEVTSLIKDYLVGRTLFNYDRISMSEFGRSMGPLFSVFSKWPTTIAADVIDKLEEKGVMKGGRDVLIKYMAPLAFLTMMDKMADGLDVSPEKSDLAYRLIGKEGFSGMAPINSINPLLEGTMVKPPVVEALAGGIMALVKADPEALWKWANKTGQAFLPGSGMLRFMVEDLPVWAGEDRVEGPFAEKIYKRVTGER